MRVGVIGVGRMGSFHAAALRDLGEVTDVVLVDADPLRAKLVAGEVGAEAASDVEALLAMRPHGVVCAAPTSENLNLVRQCVAARVPAFCEKPVTLDSVLCRELIAEVEAAGAVVQVGFQRRFDIEFAALRHRLASGELGRCYTIRMVSCDAEPPPRDYVPRSGGLFKDLQIHDFDLLCWLTGQDPVEVFAMGVNREDRIFAENNDFDGAAAVVRLADDSLATLVAGRYNPAGYDVRLEVATSRGTFSAGLGPRTPLRPALAEVPANDDAYTGFIDRFRNAYLEEMAAFVNLIRGRIDNPCPPQAALTALRLAEAVKLSAETNRPVLLADGAAA